jgi:hypothetical protein
MELYKIHFTLTMLFTDNAYGMVTSPGSVAPT